MVWPDVRDVRIGGSISSLREEIRGVPEAIVAFGHDSGAEIQARSGARVSFDWVLQRYRWNASRGISEAVDFLAVEVQSIDITGNYRATFRAYDQLKRGRTVSEIPPSNHGLNWANVHKRLIPQLVRKGSLIDLCDRSRGFFFVVPDVVFQRFEEVVVDLEHQQTFGRGLLSVLPLRLGPQSSAGTIRPLQLLTPYHFKQADFAYASIRGQPREAARSFDDRLKTILC